MVFLHGPRTIYGHVTMTMSPKMIDHPLYLLFIYYLNTSFPNIQIIKLFDHTVKSILIL